MKKLEVVEGAVFHCQGQSSKPVERQLEERFGVCEVVYPSDLTQLRCRRKETCDLREIGVADIPCMELECAQLWDTVLG